MVTDVEMSVYVMGVTAVFAGSLGTYAAIKEKYPNAFSYFEEKLDRIR